MRNSAVRCTTVECLKAFLVAAVDRQPEPTDHAGTVREHLEALQADLKVLAGRILPISGSKPQGA